MKADPTISTGAISIYSQNDAMDDFPVLKAFQQYIDAEQAKARKRLITLGIFFGVLMGAVIAVFVIMLMGVTARNQALNDRLIEFAMQERNQHHQPAVVVQPPLQQDNAALLAVTAKLEEMQKKFTEKEEAEKKARQEAAEKAKKAEVAKAPKKPTAEETEIAKLKALLAAEKEKVKNAELEAYRRKHYPELYAPKPEKRAQLEIAEEKIPARKRVPAEVDDSIDEALEVLEELENLDDDAAINYFDSETDEVPVTRKKKIRRRGAKKASTPPSPSRPENDYYSIPVDIRGVKSNWSVPND
jgi:hypothetical protein